MSSVRPLTPQELYRVCDPVQFDFESTAELENLGHIIGQERAIGAIRFGIGIDRLGYNLFALGPSGTGKRTTIRRYLDERALTEPTPPDWCYVNNFDQPHKPRVLQMPPGKGSLLSKDMAQLIEELRVAIPSAFESEDYRTRKQEVEEAFKEQQEKAFGELQRRALESSIGLMRTPSGLAFVPLRMEEGKEEKEVITPDEFQKLPEEQRKKIETDIASCRNNSRRPCARCATSSAVCVTKCASSTGRWRCSPSATASRSCSSSTPICRRWSST